MTGVSNGFAYAPTEAYWEALLAAVAAVIAFHSANPLVAGIAKADEPTRAKIKEGVLRLAAQSSAGGKTGLNGSAIVVWAKS